MRDDIASQDNAQSPIASQDNAQSLPVPFFVKSSKNKECLVLDGYLYYNDAARDPTVWRCARRKKDKCQRRCKIVDGKVYSNTQIEHTHKALSEKEISLMKINADVKKISIERPDDKPFLIITSVLKENNCKEIFENNFTNFRQNAYLAKRKALPFHPRSKEHCINTMKELSSDNSHHSFIRSVNNGSVSNSGSRGQVGTVIIGNPSEHSDQRI